MTGKENNIGHGQIREIQFRAWNKRKNKMEIVDELNHISSRSKDGLLGVNGVNGTIGIQGGEFDECYVMQRTGLTDKNGVRIFEGDIVYCNIPHRGVHRVVKWSEDGGFILNNIRDYLNGVDTSGWGSSSSVRSYHINRRGISIIGNIHENKDLLTP